MKLNQECFRDCLIFLEDNLVFGKTINVLSIELKDYSKEDIVYSFLKLLEADFIKGETAYIVNDVYIFHVSDITFKGHECLSNIHNDNVWNKTKEIAKGFGSISVQILSNIASQVLAQMISNSLHLPQTTNLPQ